ncbi:putative glycosyl hydrolase [Trypanosoma conorhini]|uniref:Putative glycosyl hydrolase n=1 Tax=Trypanosoma conorhini TaxID=83891 RepID=A0A3R7N8C5_9TRYP|nr:putative glycosyl hydrolase [Trypanosoma conorhini]RNF27116.1 putative glycosyl hydrolase [Trypanosoma conorhini]
MGSPPSPTELGQRLVCEPWEFIETTLPQGGNVAISESLFSVGNGHVSVRGYAEEAEAAAPYGRNANQNHKGGRRSEDKGERATPAEGAQSPAHEFRGTYINGVYEERLLAQNHRRFTVGTCARECFLIRVPDTFCIDVFVGSEHVNAATGAILSHRRVLDLRTGELRRRFVWQSTNHGREVTIESSRFVSLSRKSIAALRLYVTAKNVSNTDIRVVSRTMVTADVQKHLKLENIVARHTLIEASTAVSARTRNSCKRLVVAATEACCTVSIDPGSSPRANFCGTSSTTPPASTQGEGSLAGTARFDLTPPSAPQPLPLPQPQPQPQPLPQQQQQQKSFTILAPKCAETIESAETIYTSVISESTMLEITKYVAFLSDEDAAPEDMCDLAILKSREAAGVTYDAMLEENRNLVENFWEVADVRVRTDNPSMQGALRFNLLHLYMSLSRAYVVESPPRGLMNEIDAGLHQWDVDAIVIPFFSHIHPKTARALLQFRIDTLPQARNIAADMDLPRGALYPLRTVSGGENSPLPFCAAFLYSNAVIAYAIRRYILATNDTALLLQGGADVVFSTVLIWLIWGTWDKGQFHIRSVGGPDEYSGLSDNNLFTNLMAQNHMQWAVQLALELQEKHPQEWEGLKERCQITDEDLRMLERAASKMVILFDAKNRVHPGDQFFMRKKKWGFCDVKKKRGFLIQTFDPSVIYRHQVCWTPDVVLASVLLPETFTADELRADYSFYEPITSNDSSLNPMIFSVVASQLGMIDKAMLHFNRALFVDIDNVIDNTGRGLHSVAEAGSWWCFAAGFGGMRILRGVLHFNPILPDEWEEYQFAVRHSGCLVRVHVARRVVTYKVVEGLDGDSKLLIIHSDTNRIHLQLGIPASVRLYRDVHVFDFDCVVFDMDSIIQDVEDYHYEAWKKALEPFLREAVGHSFMLTGELYLAYLKHDRPLPALQRFLAKQGVMDVALGDPEDSMEQNTIHGLFRRKQGYFRQCVRYRGLRPREGIIDVLSELRQSGISVGCVTVSKNGHWLLNEASQGVLMLDGCLDGGDGEKMGLRWRPEMDYFSSMCKQLNASPSRTVIVMDGIDGFSKSALEQFKMIVDVAKDPEPVTLSIPCTNISKLSELTLTLLDEKTASDYSIYGRGATSQRGYPRSSNDIWASFGGGTLKT